MGARFRLFAHRDPFDHEGTRGAFLAAMRENAAYHIAHCPAYRKIAAHQGFSPEQLECEEDLARLPVLPTVLFKRHRLYSMPEHRMAVKATSHGAMTWR